MQTIAVSVAVLILLVAGAGVAESQLTSIPSGAPMTSIPSGSMSGASIPGREPDAIDQVRQRALAPIPQAPGLPAGPTDRWVPERRVFSSEYQREIIIPGHYESRINDQQYGVPTLPGYGTRGQLPVVIPGGDRPPPEQRPGF